MFRTLMTLVLCALAVSSAADAQPTRFTVRGRVVDSVGTAGAGVWVGALERCSLCDYSDIGGETDSLGRFQFEVPKAASYTLAIVVDGFVQTSGSAIVELPRDSTREFELRFAGCFKPECSRPRRHDVSVSGSLTSAWTQRARTL